MCNRSERNMEDITEIKSKLEKIIDRAIKIERDGCEFLGEPIPDAQYNLCLKMGECKAQGKTMVYQGMTPVKENLYCTAHKKLNDKLDPKVKEFGRNKDYAMTEEEYHHNEI